MKSPGSRRSGAFVAMLPLRLVVGWMFFSAFHRRVILEPSKLEPDVAGYVGEKFNQFMPGAILGVDKLIATLLDNPSALHTFLWSFTIIEALVGLALIFGAATRFSALGTLLLSLGILLGAGWLGPTCLDEWQIGAMGIAGGAALMLAGPGPLSVDSFLSRVRPRLFERRLVQLAASPQPSPSLALGSGLALAAFAITLLTNQVFHGGLYGTLRNDSVKPRVDILSAELVDHGQLRLTLERPVGPETYGAFVIALRLLDLEGSPVRTYNAEALTAISPEDIQNRWLVKVRTGPHSLVLPLGARATLTLRDELELAPGRYRIELEDVSGARFLSPELELTSHATQPSAQRAGRVEQPSS